MKVAILGANGFIGSHLTENVSKHHIVSPITRDNYKLSMGQSFDVIINAAGNNKNFWATQHPIEDLESSFMYTYKTLLDFKFKYYIFLSSIATYDPNSTYGLHKILTEDMLYRKIVNNNIILRCSATIGLGMKLGVIKDILDNNPLYISSESTLQFISVTALCEIIMEILLDPYAYCFNSPINVGGLGTIKIQEIEDTIKRPIKYHEITKTQNYEMPIDELLCTQLYPKLKTSKEYVTETLLMLQNS